MESCLFSLYRRRCRHHHHHIAIGSACYCAAAAEHATQAPSNLVTQTVYGFLDFTTTIGNTVMVFSPQSAPPPGRLSLETTFNFKADEMFEHFEQLTKSTDKNMFAFNGINFGR